jgi:hypothetical protein
MAEPESRPLPPYPTAGGSHQLDARAWEWVQSEGAGPAPDAAAPAPVGAARALVAAAPAKLNATSQAA